MGRQIEMQMKALEYKYTKILIFLILNHSEEKRMRVDLHFELKRLERNEGQFYMGIVEHGPYMKLTSEQWFKLPSCFRAKILRSELPLRKILSSRQIKELPSPIG